MTIRLPILQPNTRAVAIKTQAVLFMTAFLLAGCVSSGPKTGSLPKPLVPAVRQRNQTFARYVLQTMVSDLRSLQTSREEMAYIDEFAQQHDSRQPIFACIEFTYKPLRFPKTEKRFMPTGYSFGFWLWDLWCGAPTALGSRSLHPLGLGMNGVDRRGEINRIGVGIASDYAGAVPAEVKTVVESSISLFRSLHNFDSWQRGTGQLQGGLFVVRAPTPGSSDVTLVFGISNDRPMPLDLHLVSPYIQWTVDDRKPARVQTVGALSAQMTPEEVVLPSHRAVMFQPYKVSLGGPGRHQVRAEMFNPGSQAKCIAQAVMDIEVRAPKPKNK